MQIMQKLKDILALGDKVIPGNQLSLRLSLITLLLNRNILIEDVPGMGKTTLVKFLAVITGHDFRRIQFTSDLMPGDILGVSIFQKDSEQFVFKPGPIFGELILADELNRGTPKTQSALLQAMEEKNVTVDGITHALPERFCIFATQNPRGQYGTYPLPESQLDRFLFKTSMGHLTRDQEVELLGSPRRSSMLEEIKPQLTRIDLIEAEKKIRSVSASKLLLEYVSDVLQKSRHQKDVHGLSPRAGLDLMDASRAWAFFENRDYVIPDDVQNVFPHVASHRMYAYQNTDMQSAESRARDFLRDISFVKER